MFAGIDTGKARQISVAGRYRCEIALSAVWKRDELCRRLLSQHRLPKELPDHSPCARAILSEFFIRSIAMKLSNRFVTFIFAILLASLLGCAATSTKEGTGEYFDDTAITTKVKAAIFNEPSLKSSEINVETFKGTVQLSGFVSSRTDINKAVELARGVKGVTSVRNDMRLK
jgi:BON domain